MGSSPVLHSVGSFTVFPVPPAGSEIELHHIDPEPERVEVGHDRLIYTFNLPDPTRPTAVTYYLEANTYGRMPLRVGLDAGPQLNFSQFYYP